MTRDSRPDDFVLLIALEKLPLDRGVFIEAAGRELAVFRLAEPPEVYVIDNSCPHAGGNLSAGELVKKGVVRCPWHAWKFRLCDGTSADGGAARVNAYPAEIRDGQVYVKLTPRPRGGPGRSSAQPVP